MIPSRPAALMTVLALLTACSKAPAPPPPEDATMNRTGAAPPSSAASASVPRSPIPAQLRALGTEPFWNADIDGTTLTYRTPEFPGGIRITVSRTDGQGPDGPQTVFSGTLDGKPLALTVSSGTCGDGMSDRVYALTAVREIGPDIQRGCAQPR